MAFRSSRVARRRQGLLLLKERARRWRGLSIAASEPLRRVRVGLQGMPASAPMAAMRLRRAWASSVAVARTGRGRTPASNARARGASPAGPGERIARRGRPSVSPARWIWVGRPPRERPRAWSRPPPVSGGRWLMRTHDGAGEQERVLVALRRQGIEPPRPPARVGPAGDTLRPRLPLPGARRPGGPGGARTKPPPHRGAAQPGGRPRPARVARLAQKQTVAAPPLRSRPLIARHPRPSPTASRVERPDSHHTL